jgi:chromosome segregation ATPase
MIRDLFAELRQGRDAGLAQYSSRAVGMQAELRERERRAKDNLERRQREAEVPEMPALEESFAENDWDEARADGGDNEPREREDELEGQLRKRETELDEHRALQAEAANEIERLSARNAELEAERDSLVRVLAMPNVKKSLVKRFFPDANPGADPATLQTLTEMAKVINEAYAIVEKVQASA